MADQKVYEFDAEIRQSDDKGAGAFVSFPYDRCLVGSVEPIMIMNRAVVHGVAPRG